jgi:hypothetical protein
VIIEELFTDPDRRAHGGRPDMDPLTDEDALEEASLMSVRFDVWTSTLGLLFDCRLAMNLWSGNTGVLIARGIDAFNWAIRSTQVHPFYNHEVGASRPAPDGDRWTLRLIVESGSELFVRARSAEFFAGDIPGFDDRQPDFGDDSPEYIRSEMQSWDKVFVPRAATFLDPYDESW